MNKPKVKTLFYKIRDGKTVSYESPSPLSFSNDLGDYCTRDSILIIEPRSHFVRESDARAAIEPFLRTWEAQANLSSQCGDTIGFVFDCSEIIDLAPETNTKEKKIYLETGGYLTAFGNVSLLVKRRKYPNPPESAFLYPDFESAYLRWQRYKEGHEPLQSMAYFVLTLMEGLAGGRNEAAKHFAIDKAVLAEIGKLASTKGTPLTARKAGITGDLSGEENAWLEKAIPTLILQLGQKLGGHALTKVDMVSLS